MLQMLQNLQNSKFCKISKFQLHNVVDFEKCCKTRILNYFLAKIGADTAEIERNFAEVLPKISKSRVPIYDGGVRRATLAGLS